MKKKNKNPEALKLKGIKSIGIKLIVTIVIMNLVILTTIGLVSILSMRASVKEDSINSLSHITTLINNTVELKVLGEKKTLEKLSDFPGLNSMDFNKQQTILKSMVENYEYLNMAIANKKGMAKFADGNEYDLSEREYIKKALAGETVISDVIVGKDGSVVFMYATPLKKDDQIVGVLVAVQDGYELSEIVESIEPSENGYVFAINNQGIMVGHRRREFITEQYNPIEASKTNNDLVSLANAFNVILSKKEGIADYKFEGRHMNVAFEPVEGTVWYIVAASPDADFLAGINRIQTMLIILFIGALIISVIIALILGNRISAPIKIINKAIDKLANYNLDTSEEREQAKKWANNKDEIGQMLRSIKLMVNNLKSIVENISSHASSTSTTAKELTTTARNTKESAREVASAVNNIAQGATGQAHDTTVAAQNIEENSKSINEMMNILKELKIATENIDNKKDEGKTALNGLAKLSEENKEEAGIINQIINETNESAENISKASEMIQSIADQTNLLALNAAIEAARAGEAGKGFAVVADEIRKLAEDSTKFTEEIRIIINELREKVGIAVTRMERAAEIVEKSDAQNKITKNKFDAIEDAVEKSKTIVNHIHESSRSIEENNTQIIGIIQNLSAIAEENAATTEEASASVDTQTQSINDISSASDNLSDIASELQDEVSNFKL